MHPNFQLEKVCKMVAAYAYSLILNGRCRGTKKEKTSSLSKKVNATSEGLIL